MRFHAWGHPNVLATHKTTLEITRDDFLTKRGDCIVAIRCTSGLSDLKEVLESQKGERCEVLMRAGGFEERITGRVSPSSTFTSRHAIILRKSDFACERTALIMCDKAACDLDRRLVLKMRNPEEKMEIEFLFCPHDCLRKV